MPQQADSVKKHSFDAAEPPLQPDTGSVLKHKEEKSDSANVKEHVKKKERDKKKEHDNKREQANKPEQTEKKEQTAKQEQSNNKEQQTQKPVNSVQQPNLTLVTSAIPAQDSANGLSLFTGHELKIIPQTDKIHFQNRQYWVESIILFSLLIIVWARNVHTKRFTRISKAFFNIREFYQVVQDEYAMTNSLSIGLVLLFVLILSVFIYQVNGFYNLFASTPSPFLFYLKIVVIVLVFSIIKLLIVNMLGSLFYGRSEKVANFVYNIFLMNNISGIALIPIVIFTAYFTVVSRPAILVASAIVLISIYLYRMWRAFRISSGEGNVSRLYFFVYLCSLELVPFLVIFKVIGSR
jgi:hypothetical protein